MRFLKSGDKKERNRAFVIPKSPAFPKRQGAVSNSLGFTRDDVDEQFAGIETQRSCREEENGDSFREEWLY